MELSKADFDLLDRYLDRVLSAVQTDELSPEDARNDLKRAFLELASEDKDCFKAYLAASIADSKGESHA